MSDAVLLLMGIAEKYRLAAMGTVKSVSSSLTPTLSTPWTGTRTGARGDLKRGGITASRMDIR